MCQYNFAYTVKCIMPRQEAFLPKLITVCGHKLPYDGILMAFGGNKKT